MFLNERRLYKNMIKFLVRLV